MENEIKVGDYCRTSAGKIFKCSEIVLGNIPKDENKTMIVQYIVKHSPNLIDLIQKDDFVNKCRVYEVEEKGITVYQTVENSATDYNWISFDEIQEIVTKEMMESISYKVTKM